MPTPEQIKDRRAKWADALRSGQHIGMRQPTSLQRALKEGSLFLMAFQGLPGGRHSDSGSSCVSAM